jgi:hypothetical protein
MKSVKIKKPEFNLSIYTNYHFNWLPKFRKDGLRWKDKFDTPRCESCPYFSFEWLWFQVYGIWGCDRYWEQVLWINEWNNGNYEHAKISWPWSDGINKESTWDDNLIIK